MIYCLLFIFLAAFFSAVMDKTKDTIQYETSVFYRWNWNPAFWNDSIPTHYLWPTKYKINAWHLAKSCMGLSFFGFAVCFKEFVDKYSIYDLLFFMFFGIFVFTTMYHKVLYRKKLN